jgi:flagellar biosynthesis GTPase FlhF
LNASSFTERLPYKENIPEHFQLKHKKAKLQNAFSLQYHRQESTNQGLHLKDAQRNSELPHNLSLDQENRRPARRWSKHGTNYENVDWDGSVQHQNTQDIPYVSKTQTTGEFRTMNELNYRAIRSPVRYERRHEFVPSVFEIRYDHPKSNLCNFGLSNPNHKAPAMEEDYGFSDFKLRKTTSVWEKKVTSTRRPSTASSYARNAGDTSSVSGTLSRSVARVIKRRKHVVLLGLDGSGKTTILMRLKYDAKLDTTPTVGFNHEKVCHRSLV